MKKEIKNNSFVFYATSLEAVETLREAYPELANDLLTAIVEYGIYGEYDTSNPIVNAVMVNIGFGIDKAKDRYETAKANGAKGGRTRTIDREQVGELKAKGLTNKEVAEQLNCSVSSIEKINAESRKNRKNLNDNVNINVNVNNNGNKNIIDKLSSELTFAGADKSIEQLLNSGKSPDWIAAAINLKGVEHFNNFGTLGLLFNEGYQKQVDEKVNLAAANKAKAEKIAESFNSLPKEPARVIQLNSKPAREKKRYNLEDIELLNCYEA